MLIVVGAVDGFSIMNDYRLPKMKILLLVSKYLVKHIRRHDLRELIKCAKLQPDITPENIEEMLTMAQESQWEMISWYRIELRLYSGTWQGVCGHPALVQTSTEQLAKAPPIVSDYCYNLCKYYVNNYLYIYIHNLFICFLVKKKRVL